MKIRYLLSLLLVGQSLFAWDPKIKEEDKLIYAEWAGVGTIENRVFVKNIDDGYLWKSELLVQETLKGEKTEKIEFYYEQGEGPPRSMTSYVRCPAFPKVILREKVIIYLHKKSIEGKEGYFLRNHQLIEKKPEPSQSPQTTAMAVRDAAALSPRQPAPGVALF